MTKCGCEIQTKQFEVPYPMYVLGRLVSHVPEAVIVYCPLHAAAEDMLAKLKDLHAHGHDAWKCKPKICNVYQLISRAEGK